jgi:hypothetical protein
MQIADLATPYEANRADCPGASPSDEVIVISADEGYPPDVAEPSFCLKAFALSIGGTAAALMFVHTLIYSLIFVLSYEKSINPCRWTAFGFGLAALLFEVLGLLWLKVKKSARWSEKAVKIVIVGYTVALSASCMAFFVLSFASRAGVRWTALACGVLCTALMFLSCHFACRGYCAKRCRWGRAVAVWGWRAVNEDDTKPPT